MKRSTVIALSIALLMLLPPGAIAQDSRSSHWGVSFAVAPNWSGSSSTFKPIFDADAINLKGTDFEVGVVRGRDSGGEWGVSYIHRGIAGGSRVDRTLPTETCFGSSCAIYANYLLQNDAAYDGIFAHKFIPFGGSIAGRLQIGLNVGGGAGWGKRTLEQHQIAPQFTIVAGQTTGCAYTTPEGCAVLGHGETVTMVPADQLFWEQLKVFPLFTLEGAAAVRVAPGFKVRVGVGMNFPASAAVSLRASYLFGAGR